MSDKNKGVELDNCHFIKMALMLLVVLCHSVSFWSGGWFQVYQPSMILKSMKIVSGWTGSIHVYGFVFVSGYLFFYLRSSLGKYAHFSAFVVNKLKRLIIPYCFVCVVWVIPITTIFYKLPVKDIIINYILGISPAQLWFLLVLFWCYLNFWFIVKYIKTDRIIIIVSLVLYVVGAIERKVFYDFFQFFRGLQFVSIFASGYLIRKYNECIHHKMLLFFSFCLHIGMYVFSLLYNMGDFVRTAFDLVFHTASAIFIFELLQFVANSVNWQSNKTIRILIRVPCRYIYFTNRLSISLSPC